MSCKYSLNEKEELMRIITKNKISYEEELLSKSNAFLQLSLGVA